MDEIRHRLRKRLAKARKRKENGDAKDDDQPIKIDWDISLVFSPLCEVKFDGKIRALDMFMDSNLICKVNRICSSNEY